MRTGSNLRAQLDAYEASSAGGEGGAGKKPPRTWPVYAAAAGSGLALATSAGADLIYSGTQNKTASIGGGGNSIAGGAINIDGIQFNIAVSHAHRATSFNHKNYFHGVAGLHHSALGAILENGSGNVKRLASGAKISGGAGGFGSGGALFYKKQTFSGTHLRGSGQHGTWPAGHTGFAGIKFNPAGGGTDFGWIRLKWSVNGSGYPTKITAIDWAYNTVSGASIKAGQEQGPATAVPEPSTIPLCLLASGSAGVLAWRKQRRMLQAESATPAGGSGEAVV